MDFFLLCFVFSFIGAFVVLRTQKEKGTSNNNNNNNCERANAVILANIANFTCSHLFNVLFKKKKKKHCQILMYLQKYFVILELCILYSTTKLKPNVIIFLRNDSNLLYFDFDFDIDLLGKLMIIDLFSAAHSIEYQLIEQSKPSF